MARAGIAAYSYKLPARYGEIRRPQPYVGKTCLVLVLPFTDYRSQLWHEFLQVAINRRLTTRMPDVYCIAEPVQPNRSMSYVTVGS